jgi:hypothetical protein
LAERGSARLMKSRAYRHLNRFQVEPAGFTAVVEDDAQ